MHPWDAALQCSTARLSLQCSKQGSDDQLWHQLGATAFRPCCVSCDALLCQRTVGHCTNRSACRATGEVTSSAHSSGQTGCCILPRGGDVLQTTVRVCFCSPPDKRCCPGAGWCWANLSESSPAADGMVPLTLAMPAPTPPMFWSRKPAGGHASVQQRLRTCKLASKYSSLESTTCDALSCGDWDRNSTAHESGDPTVA